MKKKPSSTQNLDFLFNKLWETYKIIDDRRRKSFNVLLITITFFVIAFVLKVDKIKLPYIELEFDFFLTFTIAPIFIALLFGRYCYLCAHTMRLHIQYLIYYQKNYNDILEKIDYNINDLFVYMRIRDLSEILNPFLFPRRFKIIKRFSIIHNISRFLITIAHNILIIMTVIIPILSYILILIWLMQNIQINNSILTIVVIIIYSIIGLSIIFGLFHFYLSLKGTRKWYFNNDYN